VKTWGGESFPLEIDAGLEVEIRVVWNALTSPNLMVN
jgi:hypothetical protein